MAGCRHLYVHIPYCSSRCEYCDFFSTTGKAVAPSVYLEAVSDELTASGDSLGLLETVYLGGGTPSYAGREFLVALLAAMTGLTAPGAEVTMEANPDSFDDGMAHAVAAAGVTRLSLGVQSFDTGLRRRLGRAGSVAGVERAVRAAREAGIGSVGLDLIFAIPGETEGELEGDLEHALALEPDHISCYELTAAEGSAYRRRWQGELEKARERAADQYRFVSGRLEAAGFDWYETSNYARPGHRCRHNMAVWRGEDYLGIGAGAWSTIGNRRWRNIEDLGSYSDDPVTGRHGEELDGEQKAIEALILGLRTAEGVDTARVESVIDDGQLKILLENGIIRREGDRISIARTGRYVANDICARLIRKQAAETTSIIDFRT